MLNFIKSLFKKSNNRLTLSEWGMRNGTDKVNQHHSFAGKNYLDIYDLYFTKLRHSNVKMLEIGIRDGSSLRTFRDYFKNGTIIGLDINPETSFKENRIITYIGSQSSPEVLDKVFIDHPQINVVLDDGSHINELTIKSFHLIFDRLPKGSYYIIEDLACTYLEENLENDIKVGGWPGMDLNDASVKMVNNRSDINDFFQTIFKDLDFGKGNVEYVHFWSQICVIKKID